MHPKLTSLGLGRSPHRTPRRSNLAVRWRSFPGHREGCTCTLTRATEFWRRPPPIPHIGADFILQFTGSGVGSREGDRPPHTLPLRGWVGAAAEWTVLIISQISLRICTRLCCSTFYSTSVSLFMQVGGFFMAQ